MVNFMSELKSGTAVHGTKVKLGKLQVNLYSLFQFSPGVNYNVI